MALHLFSIQDFPMLTSIKQLQHFIWMINFYQWFIPNCATILYHRWTCWREIIQTSCWREDAQHAFHMAKIVLANFTRLSYTNSDQRMRLSLTTDSLDAGVGAVAEQEFDSQCKCIVFFLAKLSREYSTFSWELLAIYLAIKHFQHLLEGREFTIYTDHKPLTTAMSTSSNKYISREIWYLSQFSTAIRLIKGKDNTVANTLS